MTTELVQHDAEVINAKDNLLGNAIARTSKSGSNLGFRVTFHKDENGHMVESMSNLRKALKAQGYKGNVLTKKLESIWKDNDTRMRVLAHAAQEYMFEQGLRPEHLDLSSTGKSAVYRWKKAPQGRTAKSKSSAKDAANIAAATALMNTLAENGVEITFAEALTKIKG
jgi:hypothetical protein|tara:strand:- start:131 stop:634 length:504 start_codon:yes stop_codon:yes gene_type:complete